MSSEQEHEEGECQRTYIAVTSQEGLFINQHLGQAERLRIYRPGPGRPELVDIRNMPVQEKGTGRWKELSKTLKDCGWLLVGGIGSGPHVILANQEIKVFVLEGLIEDAVKAISAGESLDPMKKFDPNAGKPPCLGGCGGE